MIPITRTSEIGIPMPYRAQSVAGESINPSLTAVRGGFDALELSLPAEPVTPLLGRERDLGTAADLLRDDTIRLLTITGPGGIGKTRLALRLAHVIEGEFGDGAAYVSLAAVADPAYVGAAIAQALKVREYNNVPVLERIVHSVANRELLLVLDNFEHVRPAAADISTLLSACRHLKVLVTSRVPLHVTGEQELAIPPLDLPGADVHSPAELLEYPAVTLFAQRARSIRMDFSVSDANAAAVATICQRLDGLPLAIELAAARSKVLSPPALLARLLQGLDVLSGGPQDQPDRLRTLRAAIGWSYDLLTREEQSLFVRLAVFQGGFSLEAAEAIAEPGDRSNVLDGVTSLIDSSLLRTDPDGSGTARFAMLETVREFGLEQLATSGELSRMRSRHADYFLALADEAWPAIINRIELGPWLERIERDHDNFRSALTWSFENDAVPVALGIAGRLSWFWYLSGHLAEGRTWLERVLLATIDLATRDRALALFGVAVIAHWQGDDERAAAALDDAMQIWLGLEDHWGATNTLRMMGTVAEDQGDFETARPIYQKALDQARAAGDQPSISLTLDHLGIVNWGLGNTDAAIPYLDEALAIQQALGDAWGAAISYHFLGLIACERGDFEQSGRYLRECLALRQRIGNRKDMPHCIANLATLAVSSGDLVRGARLFGATEALQSVLGDTMKEPERSVYARSIAILESLLPAHRLSAAWEAGRSMSLAEAVSEAMTDPGTSVAHEPSPGSMLSQREQDVLRLLVKGHTDREIADALFISPRTAQGHVARLFDKLGVNTRSAAVAAALQADLVGDHSASR